MCHILLPKGRGFEKVVIIDVGAVATAGAAGGRRMQGRGTYQSTEATATAMSKNPLGGVWSQPNFQTIGDAVVRGSLLLGGRRRP
jgi:hypothetical protein